MQPTPTLFAKGDKVLCDPSFDSYKVKYKLQPDCVTPGEIIWADKKWCYIEILDARDAAGKRDFTNTRKWGATVLVIIQAVKKQDAPAPATEAKPD